MARGGSRRIVEGRPPNEVCHVNGELWRHVLALRDGTLARAEVLVIFGNPGAPNALDLHIPTP
jgi:hypothetical protein